MYGFYAERLAYFKSILPCKVLFLIVYDVFTFISLHPVIVYLHHVIKQAGAHAVKLSPLQVQNCHCDIVVLCSDSPAFVFFA